mmetsp:Transcript_61373/g.164849  ORF Transcript_61373/g.164849 Transcript_61373/m.164849 type:complete len:90 (+) Transcript_61373:48-317(+)
MLCWCRSVCLFDGPNEFVSFMLSVGSAFSDFSVVQMLFSVVPGQQLFYYGTHTWPDAVRKQMYGQFGGNPKDLATVHDYDPKVVFLLTR